MGADFTPYELKDKLNNESMRNERINELFDEFKHGNIKMDKFDNKMLELAFFTAMKAIDNNISSSSLRKIYNEIKNIKDEANKVKEGSSSWDDVITQINRARFFLAYMAGRTNAGIIYDIMDEALRKVTEVVEKSNNDKDKFNTIKSLYFFTQAIIAFHKFLGGK